MWIVPQAGVCRNILGSICTWVLLDKFHLDTAVALLLLLTLNPLQKGAKRSKIGLWLLQVRIVCACCKKHELAIGNALL